MLNEGINLQDVLADNVVQVFDITRSMYTKGQGYLTKVLAYGGKTCETSSVVTICGSARTDGRGKRTLNINDFTCIVYKEPGSGDSYEYLAPPLYFVATPVSESPALITFNVDIQSQNPETGIRIDVSTWDLEGQHLANCGFNWFCCLQHVKGV